MPICYVVPGLLGTELFTDPFGALLLWVNPGRLVLGEVGGLRIGPTGVGPGPPDGVPCTVGAPLAAYYATPQKLLQDSLNSHQYLTVPVGYDWRLEVRDQARTLATAIRRDVSAADPCAIVGHSLGGLYARAVWADLVSTGEQALIRRIVTLGTPHQGSYAVVKVWSLVAEMLDQLSLVSSAANAIQSAITPIPFTKAWTVVDLAQLTATWPAFYELLPLLGSADAGGDPYRETLYDETAWPSNRQISGYQLSFSRTDFGSFLRSSASMPPKTVLTTVAGTGVGTYDALQFPELLGNVAALRTTGDGDGLVTVASALVAQSTQVTVDCRHADLPFELAASGELAALVLDERTPPEPVPPVVHLVGGITPRLAGPPFALPLSPDPTARTLEFKTSRQCRRPV